MYGAEPVAEEDRVGLRLGEVDGALIGDSDTCAAASAGASFRPSPTKATRAPGLAERIEPGDLVRWRLAGGVFGDAERSGDRRDCLGAVARQDTAFETVRPELRHRRRRVRAEPLADRNQRGLVSVARNVSHEVPGLAAFAGGAIPQKAALPRRNSTPSTTARSP